MTKDYVTHKELMEVMTTLSNTIVDSVNGLRNEFRNSINGLKKELGSKIDHLNTNMEIHHTEIQTLVTKSFQYENKIDSMHEKLDKGFDKIDKDFSKVGHNVGKALANNFTNLEAKLDEFNRSFKEFTQDDSTHKDQ